MVLKILREHAGAIALAVVIAVAVNHVVFGVKLKDMDQRHPPEDLLLRIRSLEDKDRSHDARILSLEESLRGR